MPPLPSLKPITSKRLTDAGFRHAFFTRQGGVSSGPYQSLNLSDQVGDSPKDVDSNWRRVAQYLETTPEQICVPTQIHGSSILALATHDRAQHIRLQQADAVVGQPGGPICAVRTADCVPVLIADRRSGNAAAVHAGWKGLELGILGATIEFLVDQGGSPGDFVAAIGPHISEAAFEVGTDVAERLQKCAPDEQVLAASPVGARPRVSLLAIATSQLRSAGLGALQIDSVGGCTYANAATFFSYRRDGAQSGRMVSAIEPRKACR